MLGSPQQTGCCVIIPKTDTKNKDWQSITLQQFITLHWQYLHDNDKIIYFSSLFSRPSEHSRVFKTKYLHVHFHTAGTPRHKHLAANLNWHRISHLYTSLTLVATGLTHSEHYWWRGTPVALLLTAIHGDSQATRRPKLTLIHSTTVIRSDTGQHDWLNTDSDAHSDAGITGLIH